MDQTKLKNQLALLEMRIVTFLQEFNAKKTRLMVTDQWSVKDVLCHLVSWHEYYAANYEALAEGREQPLYEGSTGKRNLDTVRELRINKTADLITRLWRAQRTLEKSILEGKVEQMTYKKNGRVYTTPDFLDMVAGHVATHTKHIKRAK